MDKEQQKHLVAVEMALLALGLQHDKAVACG